MRCSIRQLQMTACLLLAWMGISFFSLAQQGKELLRLTMEQSQSIAAEKHPKVVASLTDEQINKQATAEATLRRIPMVYADAQLQRNWIIPVTQMPANAFDPSEPEGKKLPLRFTTRWTSHAGING